MAEQPCVTPGMIPMAGTAPTPGNTGLCLRILSSPFHWLARLLDAEDQAVSAQVLAFCILVPFSIYWLQTRPTINAQWAICFGALWTAVALHEYFRHRGGGR